jgi:hypothetical protein
MQFPLEFWDLGLWFAYMAIVLLITSEMVLPYLEEEFLALDKKPLRISALVFGSLFMFFVLMQIYRGTPA